MSENTVDNDGYLRYTVNELEARSSYKNNFDVVFMVDTASFDNVTLETYCEKILETSEKIWEVSSDVKITIYRLNGDMATHFDVYGSYGSMQELEAALQNISIQTESVGVNLSKAVDNMTNSYAERKIYCFMFFDAFNSNYQAKKISGRESLYGIKYGGKNINISVISNIPEDKKGIGDDYSKPYASALFEMTNGIEISSDNFVNEALMHIYGEVPTNKKYNMILATGLQEVELIAPITEEYAELAKLDEIDETQPDTDEDGLPDYKEINFNVKGADGKPLIEFINGVVDLPTYGECVAIKSELTYVKQGLHRYNDNDVAPYSEIYTFKVLPIVSDPTSFDGDGDGYLDALLNSQYVNSNDNNDGYIDIVDPMPLYNNIEVYSLMNDYIYITNPGSMPCIDGSHAPSYGGIQMNFYNENFNPDYYDDIGNTIREKGCGLIAVSDMMLYVDSCNVDEKITGINYDFNEAIDFFDYQYYVRTLFDEFSINFYNPIIYANCCEKYLNNKESTFKVKRFFPVLNAFTNTITFDKNWKGELNEIIRSIRNDKPVYWGVGLLQSHNMYYYRTSSYSDGVEKPFQCIPSIYGDEFTRHAVVITKIIIDSVQNKVFMVVSSWGYKYVISFEDWNNSSKFNTFFFTIE